MSEKPDTGIKAVARGILEIFATVLGRLAQDVLKMVAAFAIGTGASAAVCWYYGLPLAISLLGGFLVLGIALALVFSTIAD